MDSVDLLHGTMDNDGRPPSSTFSLFFPFFFSFSTAFVGRTNGLVKRIALRSSYAIASYVKSCSILDRVVGSGYYTKFWKEMLLVNFLVSAIFFRD